MPYYVSMVENFNGPVDYTGDESNMDKDVVAGIYVHVYLYYDGSSYTISPPMRGYIGNSITGNAVITSKCPWVE